MTIWSMSPPPDHRALLERAQPGPGQALSATLVVLATEGAGPDTGQGGRPPVPRHIPTPLGRYGPRRDLAAQIVLDQAALGDDHGLVGTAHRSWSTWVSR